MIASLALDTAALRLAAELLSTGDLRELWGMLLMACSLIDALEARRASDS